MKKFKITEERIKLLADNNSWSESKLKEWYPDAFKEVLEYGRYIKDDNNPLWITFFKNENERYGLNGNGNWYEDRGYLNPNDDKNNRYATPQEVQTALINEAKKRGFVEGVKINDIYGRKNYIKVSSNQFDYEKILTGEHVGKMALRDGYGNILFMDGQWATIIEQKEYTMQEIADALKVNVNDLKIKK